MLITDAMLEGQEKTVTYNLDGTIAQEVVVHGDATYTRLWTYPDALTMTTGLWVRS